MTVGLLSIAATPPQVLLISYGQSNMNNFWSETDGSTPSPSAGTFVYNGTTIVSPAGYGSGIITCMNAIAAATGLNVLGLNGSVNGSSTVNLIKGNASYTNLINLINAVIQPGDICFIIWDQGEGDANDAPHHVPQYYVDTLSQLHSDIVSDIGRTKTTCPFLLTALGTASSLTGTISGGTTQLSWTTIRNAQIDCGIFNPHMYYSHSTIDFTRSDGYHYVAASEALSGQRFAQSINTLLGKTSGFPHWEITGGTTVDATHTNITVQESLGTDFTPTSGGQGWGVSGDNGATFDTTATAARVNATTIQITHASMSTSKARIVQYQWGYTPPGQSGLTPTPGAIADNSAFAIPLSPTRWDVRPTPLSTIPVPTWRDSNVCTTSGASQIIPTLQLGPSSDNYQKFVILGVTQGLGPTTISSVTITPNVGSAVVATQVGSTVGTMALYQATLGVDAIGATTCSVDVEYSSNPSTNSVIQLWTVPLADLSSTTSTGQGSNTAASATACTATVNVSAGGFIIALSQNYITQTNFSSLSSGYAKRWEYPANKQGQCADASNCAASASSSFTVTFSDAGTCNVLLASWR